MAESFDDFISTEQVGQLDRPAFQFRENQNNEKETHEWLISNFDAKMRASESRLIAYRRWHALYKGIHWRHYNSRDANRTQTDLNGEVKQTVNFIWDMIESKTSQLARIKSNFTAIPAHDDILDINAVEFTELALKARTEEIGFENKNLEADKIMLNFGDVFFFVLWNPEIGPRYPKIEELLKRYPEGLPAPIKKQLGDKLNMKIGDTEVLVMGPDKVFPELECKSWDDMNEIEYIEWFDIDYLKKKYPNKAQKINQNQRQYFDYDLNQITTPLRKIMVRCYYHKKTEFFPNGAYIKYTDDCILSWNDYPYNEDCLPFVRDADILIYDELFARPSISQIEQMNRMYNNVQSTIGSDYGKGARPKWMMPKGMCNISSLNNEFTVVEFSGPIAPQLVTPNPINPKAFEVQDRIESKMSKFMRVYDISRGEVPAGVTANSALRFLDEQESQQLIVHEARKKARILKIYQKMLVRMQQFYIANDGRTVKMLGPNNEYLIQSMKEADFSRIVDVKLKNSSALPDSKTGKISTIVDLNTSTQTDPIFGKEEIIQMLDLGLDDAFVSGATVAVKAAKTILSMILRGQEVSEPKPYDKNLVHYAIFDKFVQSTTFKTSVPEETRSKILIRIGVIEMLMFEQAKKNKKFCLELMEQDNYPMYYEIPAPLSSVLAIHEQMAAPTPPPSTGADTSKVENLSKTSAE